MHDLVEQERLQQRALSALYTYQIYKAGAGGWSEIFQCAGVHSGSW